MTGVTVSNHTTQERGPTPTRNPVTQSNRDSVDGNIEINSNTNDIVTISPSALAQLEEYTNIKTANALLENNKIAIFETAFTDLKSYPENLASQLDSDSPLSTAVRSEIANRLNEREQQAFGHFAKQSPPNLEKYYKNYIQYLDSLSPEELKSERYLGQREAVVPLYQNAARENGNQPNDVSLTQDPILALFELLEAQDFEIENIESFRENYLSRLSGLLNSPENGTRFLEQAHNALHTLEKLQITISEALTGNTTALKELNALIGNNTIV